MANMASVAYAIEGSKESLEKIQTTIVEACKDKKHWTEYTACVLLGFPKEELENKKLGGEIDDDPTLENGVLRFWAEERWSLQDFEELLRQKFPDITVYWIVEESGCEVYCTNDKEGKYFADRFYIDICIDGKYSSEYFITEESMYDWLLRSTNGKIKNAEDVARFNNKHEDASTDDENFIQIHIFDIVD